MADPVRSIESLLIRYATAIDTRDWELLRSCFTPDVAATYEGLGEWNNIDDFVGFMVDAHLGFGRSNHLVTNMAIEVAGDRATSSAYVHAVLVLADDPQTWFDTIGRYEDELALMADGWRIARRSFTATRMISGTS